VKSQYDVYMCRGADDAQKIKLEMIGKILLSDEFDDCSKPMLSAWVDDVIMINHRRENKKGA